MDGRVSRYLLWSQLSLFACLAICFAIYPRFLWARREVGISNYGVRVATVAPYTLGFLLCGLLILRAAQGTPRGPALLGRFRQALLVLGALVLLVLASTYPYKVDVAFKDIHIVVGALLLASEMAMALWLTFGPTKNRSNLLLVLVQAAGCVLALITLAGALHLLFVAQLVASAAFGVLLVRVSRQLVLGQSYGEL